MGKALDKYLANKARAARAKQRLQSLENGGETHVLVDGDSRRNREEYMSMNDSLDEQNTMRDIGSIPLDQIIDTKAIMDTHESQENPRDKKVEIGVVHVDLEKKRLTVASKEVSGSRLGTIVNILIHGSSRGRRR